MKNIALVNGTSALAMQRQRQLRVVEGTKRTQRAKRAAAKRNDTPFFVGVCAIIVAIGLVSFVLGDVAHQRVSKALSSADTEVVRVIYGDTLWTIAQQHTIPGCSTKDVLSWMMQRNGLHSSKLRPGQCLVVPSEASPV